MDTNVDGNFTVVNQWTRSTPHILEYDRVVFGNGLVFVQYFVCVEVKICSFFLKEEKFFKFENIFLNNEKLF